MAIPHPVINLLLSPLLSIERYAVREKQLIEHISLLEDHLDDQEVSMIVDWCFCGADADPFCLSFF